LDSAEKDALETVLSTECGNVKVLKPGKPSISQLSGNDPSNDGPPSFGGSNEDDDKNTKKPRGTDKRYPYCYVAIAAGANTPYYRGTDPEYYWYTDSDGDGVVCE
jgi:hypothetical protein